MMEDGVVVDGVNFRHGFDRNFEFYSHADGGVEWIVCRDLNRTREEPWMAYRVTGGEDGEEVILNGAVWNGPVMEEKGPLYHLDALNPLTLVAGIAGMIRQGAGAGGPGTGTAPGRPSSA